MSIIREEFNNAVTSCGYPVPPSNVYDLLIAETQEFSRFELAMFVAQLIHQSSGFQNIEDPNPDPSEYVDTEIGLPGVSYHGRGYIMLTYASNYKAASADLGLDDLLLREPERVAQEPKHAMQVSVWFWEKVVRAETEGSENCFGATTRAINGGIECSGGFHPVAYERYQKYLKVAEAFKLERKAEECGCYN